jgi:Helix-turn-helix domain
MTTTATDNSKPAADRPKRVVRQADPTRGELLKDGLSSEQAAAILGINEETLARLRRQKRSPAYFKLFGRVIYKRADLDAYVAKQLISA